MARFPLPPADRRDLLDHDRRPVEPDVRLRAHILLLLDDGLPWATIRAGRSDGRRMRTAAAAARFRGRGRTS